MDITINKKYIIKGTLINRSPLLIGGGVIDKTKDVAFVKDWQGNPYIPGTSLAGCLMSHFREGYKIESDLDFLWGQDKEHQAQIIFDDSYLANKNYTIKIRDGVKIDNASGRALEHGLYNYESLEPNAKFIFEAEITQRNEGNKSPEKFLNTFIKCFNEEKKTFQIGALSSFGFGKMSFETLEILAFEDPDSWIKFLQTSNAKNKYQPTNDHYEPRLASYLAISVSLKQKTAFIARDYGQELSKELKNTIGVNRIENEDSSPDSITLLVNEEPVLSGKTLKGALRAQGVTIINTIIGISDENYIPLTNPSTISDELFGKWIKNRGDERQKSKSLLEIEETQISELSKLKLHQRVSIDRFSGGAMESKLFNSVPVYPNNNKLTVNMRLKISKNLSETKAHLALLLYIFRDLNAKLFSVGGEKSIGRGLFDVLDMDVSGRKEFQCHLNFETMKDWDELPKSWITEFHKQLKA